MSRAVLSIGSNRGDRLAHLRTVVDACAPQLTAVSSVYSTAPWGGVPQRNFLNAVLVVDDPALTSHDWLRIGQELEQAAGRAREIRWGARTLDVDVIWCVERRHGVQVICRSTDPMLTLPHPRAHRRAFVLVPWLEVDFDAELEVQGITRPVRELVQDLGSVELEGVRRTEHSLRPRGWVS